MGCWPGSRLLSSVGSVDGSPRGGEAASVPARATVAFESSGTIEWSHWTDRNPIAPEEVLGSPVLIF